MRVPTGDDAVVADHSSGDRGYHSRDSVACELEENPRPRRRTTTAPSAKRALDGTPASGLRVALVHEWLETFSGSERVLEQLLHCFDSADVFTVVDFMNEDDRRFLQGRPVRTRDRHDFGTRRL